MKQILIILKCPLTNQGRMINFLNSLSKIHNVTLFSLDDGNKIKSEKITHYTYHIKNGILNKLLKHSFFWLEFFELTKIIKNQLEEKDFDFIICHDLPVLYPSLKLKKHFQSKLMYDSLEIYNETINQFFPATKGVKKVISNFLIKFMRWNGEIAENFLIKKCDITTTVNTSLAKFFEEKYNVSNVKVIMNCPKKFHPNKEIEFNFREFYGFRPDDTIFLYQGFLNEGRGLEILIKSFNKLIKEYPTTRLIIIGSGPLSAKLKNLVEYYSLNKNIKFHRQVDYNKLLNYTVQADFGINLLESFNLSKKLASPNKLFEYIQAGIPVLCSFSPENNKLMNKFHIGEQCNNTTLGIYQSMKNLIEIRPENIIELKKNIKKAQRIYNWTEQEKNLLSLF